MVPRGGYGETALALTVLALLAAPGAVLAGSPGHLHADLFGAVPGVSVRGIAAASTPWQAAGAVDWTATALLVHGYMRGTRRAPARLSVVVTCAGGRHVAVGQVAVAADGAFHVKTQASVPATCAQPIVLLGSGSGAGAIRQWLVASDFVPDGKFGASHPVASPAARSGWLASSATQRLATITLQAGLGTVNGGFNFDGYAGGQMVVTVPTGWSVRVNLRNATTVQHSAMVVSWSTSLGAAHPAPAFAGAATADPYTGLAQGATAHFTFRPTRPGRYRLICAVPGHADIGMWATLVVSGGLGAATLSVAH